MSKLLLLIFSIIVCRATAQQPNTYDTAWVSSFGGVGIDEGRDIKETKDHGFLALGITTSFGFGSTDFYLVKTDSIGNKLWSKCYGSESIDVATSLEYNINTNTAYLIGYCSGADAAGYDGVIYKIDSLGNIIWKKIYGGSDWDFFLGSALLSDGNIAICGETFNNSKGMSDAYLMSISANGDTNWTKTIGNQGADRFNNVIQFGSNLFAVGANENTVTLSSSGSIARFSLNGQLMYSDTITFASASCELFDITETFDKKLYACGQITVPGNRHAILHFDTLLNLIDVTTNNDNFFLRSIIEGYQNDIYTIGPKPGGLGGTGAFLIRYNSSLAYLNSANFGGPENEDGYKIIKTSRGYAFIGSTLSYGNANGSSEKNLYLVIFNKKALVNDYFILSVENQDSPLNIILDSQILNTVDLSVFPNPAFDSFQIKFLSSQNSAKCLTVYDSEGSTKLIIDIPPSSSTYTIFKSQIGSGYFLLEITDVKSGQRQYRKVLIF